MRVFIIFSLLLFSQSISAQDAYVNPVDGKTYVADWKLYQPEHGVKPQNGRVVNAGVRLLSTQSEFDKNTTPEDLAKIIQFIQATLAKLTRDYKGGGEILLQIEIKSTSNPDFKMSYQGNLNAKYLQRFYDSLKTIDYKSKEKSVTLQLHFKVKNA